MDNFMEKITHKFSATDMIKANSQAEAVAMESQREQLRLFEEQMEKVDAAISDIRELNLKNIENAQELRDMTKNSEDKMGEAVNRMENESVSRIKETSDLSIAGINRTLDESIAKIEQIKEAADSTEAINAGMDAINDKLQNMRRELEEYLHSDHVKIYRNVQASFAEELTKQVLELKSAYKKKGALLYIAIITMVLVIVDLVINILRIFGMI